MKAMRKIGSKVNQVVIWIRYGILPGKQEKERGGSEMVVVLGLIIVGIVLLGLFKDKLFGTANKAFSTIGNDVDKLFQGFNEHTNQTF